MEAVEQEKGANQIWKESGTTLGFTEWIEREKAKGSFIPNKIVADTTAMIRKNIGLINKDKSYVVNPKNNNTILGLNKWILLSSLVLIGGAIAFSVYNKNK